jgi:hypothetical protein
MDRQITLEDMENISVTVKVGDQEITKKMYDANIKMRLNEIRIGATRDDYRLHSVMDLFIDEIFSFDLGPVGMTVIDTQELERRGWTREEIKSVYFDFAQAGGSLESIQQLEELLEEHGKKTTDTKRD